MELKEVQIGESDSDSLDNSDGSNSLATEVGNPGWADSIAQVLKSGKPKKKKCLVLSRAKKPQQISKEKKLYDFEIEGEINEGKPNINEIDDVKKEIKPKLNLSYRVRPKDQDREREKTLKRIATKGVVQLFNAVRMQQKDLNKQLDEAGPLDHKKDAVLNNINKRKFLDVLMGGERAKSEMIDNHIKDEKLKEESNENLIHKNSESQWSVLRDDFMTNKKLKHWDKEDSDTD